MFDPNARGARYEELNSAVLAPLAATMLMTLLYSVRVGRYDLFKAVQALAKLITRWDAKCDRRLHRIMSYVRSTADYKMVGWIGDSPEKLTAHLFCGADFADCPYTLIFYFGVSHGYRRT